jgi:DNA repair exonuclease SbcCD ATPase subunit
MNTIKFLAIGDFHFSAKNKDICLSNAIAVQETAKKHHVDFILDAGDWWDSPHYASDKGGIKIALEIMKRWSGVCPVAGIYGTPSHQSPGSMEIFRDYFTVLEAGKVYGIDSMTDEIVCNIDQTLAKCILFGIPEVTKTNIQAKLGLSAEQANSKAEELYYQYVDSFIAPMRLKYKNIPAVCAVHGNFSDSRKETSNDKILESSDIVIHNEQLRGADVDYWACSHIHKPQQFEEISGGYCGSWGKDWNETGFLPGFNLVTIENGKTTVERIPYGTPERRKVSLPFTGWKPQIAYKVVTTDREYKLPENIHPWSEIEYKPEERTTKRITHEQAQTAKSLWDWFLLADPKAKKLLKPLVDEIPDFKQSDIAKKNIVVDLQSVEISGCVFFKGKNINLDMNNLPKSLVGVEGDNGAGKSSLLSFCTPFPVIAGKLPTSGRQSAIWEFFNQKESMIKKVFAVNGQKHEHLITIKAAHTKTPKTECYLTIDGVPALELATFDEMFSKCEELYGPYNDYLITTFYVQPQQGGKETNLMNAPMTEVRNIVQNIAGIDYSKHKEFALNKKSDTERQAEDIRKFIEIKSDDISGADDLSERIKILEFELSESEKAIDLVIKNGKAAKALLDEYIELDSDNKSKAAVQKSLADDVENASDRLELLSTEIESLKDLSRNLETLKKEKSCYDKRAARISELKAKKNEIDSENNDLEKSYNRILSEWNSKAAEIDLSKRSAAKSKIDKQLSIKEKQKLIEQYNKPCEHCGKNSTTAEQCIEDLKGEIDNLHIEIQALENTVFDELPPEPNVPKYSEFDNSELNKLIKEQPTSINDIETKLSQAEKSNTRISEINAEISALNKTISDKTEQIRNIVVDDTIHDKLEIQKNVVNNLTTRYREISETISSDKASIKNLQEKLQEIETLIRTIEQKKTELKKFEQSADDWKYISGMLNPDKIPAIELETIIDMIDQDATDILKTFQDGRYSVKTVTQIEGKKKTVDKFDIMIHDSETGQEKSFMKWSPGERSFPSDAYVKALVKQRMRRHNVVYSPIILDEIDGPVSPARVGMFYDMQKAYYNEFDIPVLVVTHSSDSQQYIENRVYVEDLKV